MDYRFSPPTNSYAISNDEAAQRQRANPGVIIAYYLSGFTDQGLFHFGNLYFYGIRHPDYWWSKESAAADVPDPYAVRHLLAAA